MMQLNLCYPLHFNYQQILNQPFSRSCNCCLIFKYQRSQYFGGHLQGPTILALVVTHTMCPEVVINSTGSTAYMNSFPASSMLQTTFSSVSKTIFPYVVPVTSIILIGWLGCCILKFHGLNHGLHLMDMVEIFCWQS